MHCVPPIHNRHPVLRLVCCFLCRQATRESASAPRTVAMVPGRTGLAPRPPDIKVGQGIGWWTSITFLQHQSRDCSAQLFSLADEPMTLMQVFLLPTFSFSSLSFLSLSSALIVWLHPLRRQSVRTAVLLGFISVYSESFVHVCMSFVWSTWVTKCSQQYDQQQSVI